MTLDELPAFVRLRDLRALGFGAVDAARLQRRAAVVDAIDEAEVQRT
jgi:hypothetical protein